MLEFSRKAHSEEMISHLVIGKQLVHRDTPKTDIHKYRYTKHNTSRTNHHSLPYAPCKPFPFEWAPIHEREQIKIHSNAHYHPKSVFHVKICRYLFPRNGNLGLTSQLSNRFAQNWNLHQWSFVCNEQYWHHPGQSFYVSIIR